MERTTGVAGLLGFLLLFTALGAIASVGEPPLLADTAEAAAFFRNADTSWMQTVLALFGVGMLLLLWFLVGLSLVLRGAEGDPPWRSTVALASGVLFVAYGLQTSWAAASHRGDEIDPALAAYAFDVGNIGFANAWLVMGSFAFASGWAMVSTTGVFPRWLGWWGVVSGAALALARFAWTVESAWIVPYLAVWLWMLTTAVLLVRRRPVVEPEADRSAGRAAT
jgi:hypothetical protein